MYTEIFNWNNLCKLLIELIYLSMLNYTAELSLLKHMQLFLIMKTHILEIYVDLLCCWLILLHCFLRAPQNKEHNNNLT